jgi:hypothetical protein
LDYIVPEYGNDFIREIVFRRPQLITTEAL